MEGGMEALLGTARLGSWAVTELRNSLLSELSEDEASHTLRLFIYAITSTGWQELRTTVKRWKKAKPSRRVVAFVGTDHGLTDPDALTRLKDDGVDVRLMVTYSGVFHPKVFWLEGESTSLVWIGSNNLTRDGLVNNIEFAALVKSPSAAPASLATWANKVEGGSAELTDELLASYKKERDLFESSRAAATTGTFTWSKKKEPPRSVGPTLRSGDLLIEIMPQETRGGNQIQIPIAAAAKFFGLSGIGSQLPIRLRRAGTTQTRDLMLTVFGNNTVRVSLNELEYRDRPCLVQFRRSRGNVIEFEIVPESIFPTRYKAMLLKCGRQTRAGSRRWTIAG
jgi:hypothetical protein